MLAIIQYLFDTWVQYRLEKAKIKASIANKPYVMVENLIKQTTDASKEQTKVLQEWLAGFKTTTLPTSSIVRDIDEYTQEQDRLQEQLMASDNLTLGQMAAENLKGL